MAHVARDRQIYGMCYIACLPPNAFPFLGLLHLTPGWGVTQPQPGRPHAFLRGFFLYSSAYRFKPGRGDCLLSTLHVLFSEIADESLAPLPAEGDSAVAPGRGLLFSLKVGYLLISASSACSWPLPTAFFFPCRQASLDNQVIPPTSPLFLHFFPDPALLPAPRTCAPEFPVGRFVVARDVSIGVDSAWATLLTTEVNGVNGGLACSRFLLRVRCYYAAKCGRAATWAI